MRFVIAQADYGVTYLDHAPPSTVLDLSSTSSMLNGDTLFFLEGVEPKITILFLFEG